MLTQSTTGKNTAICAGVVYLRMKKHPNGKEFAEFEQPCAYAECYSNFYRFEEVER